jgi:hypothetical protein
MNPTPSGIGTMFSPSLHGLGAKMAANYSKLIEPLARYFWNEPNEPLSKPGELRFGMAGNIPKTASWMKICHLCWWPLPNR